MSVDIETKCGLAIKCYSAIKSQEILTCATKWMNFEYITLSEVSQTRKATNCMIPFVSLEESISETESRMVGARGQGGGGGEEWGIDVYWGQSFSSG